MRKTRCGSCRKPLDSVEGAVRLEYGWVDGSEFYQEHSIGCYCLSCAARWMK